MFCDMYLQISSVCIIRSDAYRAPIISLDIGEHAIHDHFQKLEQISVIYATYVR